MFELTVKSTSPRSQRATFRKLAELRGAAAVLAKHKMYDSKAKDWIRHRRATIKSASSVYVLKTVRKGRTYEYAKEYAGELTVWRRKQLLEGLRGSIQLQRRVARDLPLVPVYRQVRLNPEESMDLGYQRRIDGVFTESGTFVRMQERFRRQHVRMGKRPFDSSEYIGIELEVFAPHAMDAVIAALSRAGLHKHVNVGTDGSIRPRSGCSGFEFRILAKRSEYARIVRRVCEVLKTLEAKVNDSCGFHVHLDMRSRGLAGARRAFHNLVRAQDLMFSLVPHARRSNSFCQRVADREFDRSGSYDRYAAINDSAYVRHKTLEVRLHSGTCNARKIVNWISLLLKIVDAPAFETRVGSLITLQRFGVQLPKRQIAFLQDRIAKFADSFETESATEAA